MKDPLTFMTMSTPVRSIHCVHLQCFDASFFLGMMESTPTWLCPVCNRSISADDLVLDGFAADIRASVPSSYDSVVVETDGTWRTEDSKHGNSKAVQEARLKAASASVAPDTSSSSTSTLNGGGAGNRWRGDSATLLGSSKDGTPFESKPDVNNLDKGKNAVVIDLDDEDDDDNGTYVPPPPPPRPSHSVGGRAPPAKTAGGFIDLTLSDDDDEEDEDDRPIPAGRASGGAGVGQKRRIGSEVWEDDLPPHNRQRQY